MIRFLSSSLVFFFSFIILVLFVSFAFNQDISAYTLREDAQDRSRIGFRSVIVNSAGDTDDGSCSLSHCTLREAINHANNRKYPYNIVFSIEQKGDVRDVRIVPNSPFPPITSPVAIDATTQPGYTEGNPAITIDTGNILCRGFCHIFSIQNEDVVFKGFEFDKKSNWHVGIYTEAANTTIEHNVFKSYKTVDDFDMSIHLESDHNFVSNNVFKDGESGIRVYNANNNTIVNNTFQDMYVGIEIYGDSDMNTIGGAPENGNAFRNLDNIGIHIHDNSDSTQVMNNSFLDVQHGLLVGTSHNVISNNSFENGLFHIRQFSGMQNTYSQNRSDGSSYTPFDLMSGNDSSVSGYVTSNDLLDTDGGTNQLQNYPVLQRAVTAEDGKATVTGQLNSKPSQTFTVELFNSDTCNAFARGAQRFITSTGITTNSSGNANFSFGDLIGVAAPGSFMSATATDSSGNTSEVSSCIQVEELTFTVNSSNDGDDGYCTKGHCSLREAINRSNNKPGQDTISFSIPGTENHIISVIQRLPDVTDSAVLDATSQPGYSGTPKITVYGVNAPTSVLKTTARQTTIRGFHFSKDLLFGTVVAVEGNFSNVVENTFSSPAVNSLELLSIRSNNNTIHHNVIGPAPYGLGVYGSSNSVYANDISGNHIIGIRLNGERNVIGGPGTAWANTVNRNGVFGAIQLSGNNNIIERNHFESNEYGISSVSGVNNTSIRFNTFKNTVFDAIEIYNNSSGFDTQSNKISQNSIVGTTFGIGIDLGADGATPNDTLDIDEGVNGLQNKPQVVQAITYDDENVVISGTLHSKQIEGYAIEIFANTECGTNDIGQGEYFLQTVPVTTDNNGNAVFSLGVSGISKDWFITATATDVKGNTSEFSDCVSIIRATDVGVSITESADPVSPSENITYTIVVENFGELRADSISLTSTVTGRVQLLSVTGACSINQLTVTCDRSSLEAGETMIVKVTLSPRGVGTVGINSSVTTATHDTNPENDNAEETTTVQGTVILPPPCEGSTICFPFNEGEGTIVHDTSTYPGVAIDLDILNLNNVAWIAGGLVISEPTIITTDSPLLKDLPSDLNELTVEAWVIPDNSTDNGPARIISMSENTGRRNFTLGQGNGEHIPFVDGTIYTGRLRTTQTDLNGAHPQVETESNVVTPGSVQHVVYTRDSQANAKVFVDGVLVGEDSIPGDMLSSWDFSYKLALGNEHTFNRPWLGVMCHIAVFDKALTEAEILTRFEGGSEGGGISCSS